MMPHCHTAVWGDGRRQEVVVASGTKVSLQFYKVRGSDGWKDAGIECAQDIPVVGFGRSLCDLIRHPLHLLQPLLGTFSNVLWC